MTVRPQTPGPSGAAVSPPVDPGATCPSASPDSTRPPTHPGTGSPPTHPPTDPPPAPPPTKGHLPIGVPSPARQHPLTAHAGEPVKPPVAPGKEPTPGSAAASRSVARESTEVLVALGAGPSYPPPPAGGARVGGPPAPDAGAPDCNCWCCKPMTAYGYEIPGTTEIAAAINASLARRSS